MRIPFWLILGVIIAGLFRKFWHWIAIALCLVLLYLLYDDIHAEDMRIETDEAVIKPVEATFFEGVEDWLKQHTPEK